MPLSDRDYMRSTPPPRRRTWRFDTSGGFSLNPIWAIIIANLILLIAVLLSGEERYPFGDFYVIVSDRFTYYLGFIPYYFFERPWTIVTNLFIHAGFWHLFGNMITLYFFGTFLSRLVGQNKVLLLYFIGGILGNVIYLLLGDSLSVAIGASGAVYAIAGALVVLMPNMRVSLWFIIPMPLWVVVLVFFVIFSFIPGIAWQVHLGGLAAGLAFGFFFRKKTRFVYY